ncbi:JmjC domain-containing protein [Streptomyces sp. NRRL F-2799]|uniref:JmjC domain-containing protein n=1 Tax=Streptomyces sp. NRRL F-2799 TaxID=1463844 RepID=UPI0004CBA3D5|nr:cupin domain-containing protein [Streptomyces sp. NRRL F-2799]
MSLSLLLPEDGVTGLLRGWPDEPHVFERGVTAFEETVTEDFLANYAFSGCVPPQEIAVMKAPGPSLNQNSHMTNGRTDAAKLRGLHSSGHTIRLGNLQRVVPYLAAVSQGIQQETGCSNYVHAFLTPPGNQGLRHHWDQQMALVVQIAGIKRWPLWRPPVESPMRDFNESWRVWRDHFVPEWEATGPDLVIDLRAGQTLLLPRGWVHNPHVAHKTRSSAHLTFAIRERTPLWLAEKLVAEAIKDPAFRRTIRPADITGPTLAERLRETRRALHQHLDGLDPDALANTLRQVAKTELEYTT